MGMARYGAFWLMSLAAVAGATSSQRQSICLNGEWELAVSSEFTESAPTAGWQTARVPGVFRSNVAHEFAGTPEAPYQTHGAQQPVEGWYRLALRAPSGWHDGRRIAVAFDGVHFHCTVWLNGVRVGEHEGAHGPFEADITTAVRWSGENRLVVRVRAAQPINRRDSFSRYAGIWRSVYLRSHPLIHVDNVFVMPSVRKKQLRVRAWVRNDDRQGRTVHVRNAVFLGAQQILRLSDQSLTVERDEMALAEAEQAWPDPRLWGFRPYGTPTLYSLRSELRGADGTVQDVRFTRFGFREFWTDGTRFMFNGRPFFIKGDLISPSLLLVENRQFVTQYFQAERAVNVNFIRLHCRYGFTNRCWFDVADELGMLLEPQQYLSSPAKWAYRKLTDEARPLAERRWEVQKREWREWICRHWNHPSIVMYSTDNEAVSQGAWGQPPVPGKPHPVWHDLDSIHRIIRSFDPTRPIESQGNVGLGTAFKQGHYKGLEVFNVHPYGDPLGDAMDKLKARYDCPTDVPVHVGEIYAGPADPFNWWTRPAEMLRLRAAMWAAYDRAGRYFARSILSVRDHGAAGASLCAGTGRLFIGSGDTPDDMRLGPWAKELQHQDEDFSNPLARLGRGVPVNLPAYRVRWPSLSGEGVKVRWLMPGDSYIRLGNEFNWFDPTRPAFVLNVAAKHVREAFRKVDGQDVGLLSSVRAADVVVRVPRGGAYVFAEPVDGSSVSPVGVRAARDGTAWFVLWARGRYRFHCPELALATSVSVELPPLKPRAGCEHVRWVSLGGADVDSLAAALRRPVQARIVQPVDTPVNRAEENREMAEAFAANSAIVYLDRAWFEYGTAYTGPRPEWLAWVGCRGGSFDRSRRSYVVPADAKEYVGTIRIALRKGQVPAKVKVTLEAEQTGYVYIQLQARGGKVVCNNLTEASIMGETGKRGRASVVVPFEDYADASILAIRRYRGPMEVYRVRLDPL